MWVRGHLHSLIKKVTSSLGVSQMPQANLESERTILRTYPFLCLHLLKESQRKLSVGLTSASHLARTVSELQHLEKSSEVHQEKRALLVAVRRTRLTPTLFHRGSHIDLMMYNSMVTSTFLDLRSQSPRSQHRSSNLEVIKRINITTTRLLSQILQR